MNVRSDNDKEIICKDCSSPFWFTESEQVFYQERGFAQPKRCRDCRAKKKAAMNRE